MSRKNLIRSTLFPYHVTQRVNNREWFHAPIEEVWKTLSGQCFEMHLLFGVEVHAFVLMSNHLHLILSTPQEDLGQAMMHFGRSGTRTLNSISGRSGHLFSGRYRWVLIDSGIYFAHALKYVYRNPVKAGLCERVEDYPFSTLHGLVGKSHLPVPIFYPSAGYWERIPSDQDALLRWLNTPYREEHDQQIGRALRRTRFEIPRDRTYRRPSQLESELL